MTSLISITPAPKSEPGTINSQLCSFLSNNTSGAYDMKLHGIVTGSPDSHGTPALRGERHQDEHTTINPIDLLVTHYPDVETEKLLSISAIDTSFAEPAQLALFLATINDRPIELEINHVSVLVEPGQTLDDVRNNFLKSLSLETIDIKGNSVVNVNTIQQQFDGGFYFEDCVRNAMVVSQLLDKTVQFTYYSTMPWETVKGLVAPGDDYIAIVRAYDPQLRPEPKEIEHVDAQQEETA